MGKAAKSRSCPVVGRVITSAECGANRGRAYQCPPNCPHCPWAPVNYSTFLDLEEVVQMSALSFQMEHVDENQIRECAALAMRMEELMEGDDVDGALSLSFQVQEMLHGWSYRGKNLFELWREAGWKGLRGDQILVAGWMADARPALLETLEFLDDDRVLCRDLLAPGKGEFVIMDHGLASQRQRFAVVFIWVVETPFFTRPRLVGLNLPTAWIPPLEKFVEMVRELGGPDGDDLAGLRDWLRLQGHEVAMEAFRRLEDSLLAALRNSDLRDVAAFFRLLEPRETFLQRLEDREDFVREPSDEEGWERFVWLCRGPSMKFADRLPLMRNAADEDRKVWATLSIGPGEVKLECVGEKRLEVVRAMLDEMFQGALEFDRMRVTDFGAQMAGSLLSIGSGDQEQPEPSDAMEDPGLLPEERHELLQAFFANFYKKLLDENIPALDGLTPREAAQRPEMRDKLTAWAKSHVQVMDGHALREGCTFDLTEFLRELGLEELC